MLRLGQDSSAAQIRAARDNMLDQYAAVTATTGVRALLEPSVARVPLGATAAAAAASVAE